MKLFLFTLVFLFSVVRQTAHAEPRISERFNSEKNCQEYQLNKEAGEFCFVFSKMEIIPEKKITRVDIGIRKTMINDIKGWKTVDISIDMLNRIYSEMNKDCLAKELCLRTDTAPYPTLIEFKK